MDRIDLHAHTNRSDGSLEPAALVRLAADAGLRALAVTDHDTTAALPEAEAAGGGRRRRPRAPEAAQARDACGLRVALPRPRRGGPLRGRGPAPEPQRRGPRPLRAARGGPRARGERGERLPRRREAGRAPRRRE